MVSDAWSGESSAGVVGSLADIQVCLEHKQTALVGPQDADNEDRWNLEHKLEGTEDLGILERT